jgi:hypothetical protein
VRRYDRKSLKSRSSKGCAGAWPVHRPTVLVYTSIMLIVSSLWVSFDRISSLWTTILVFNPNLEGLLL